MDEGPTKIEPPQLKNNHQTLEKEVAPLSQLAAAVIGHDLFGTAAFDEHDCRDVM